MNAAVRPPSGSPVTWVAETLLQCWTHRADARRKGMLTKTSPVLDGRVLFTTFLKTMGYYIKVPKVTGMFTIEELIKSDRLNRDRFLNAYLL